MGEGLRDEDKRLLINTVPGGEGFAWRLGNPDSGFEVRRTRLGVVGRGEGCIFRTVRESAYAYAVNNIYGERSAVMSSQTQIKVSGAFISRAS